MKDEKKVFSAEAATALSEGIGLVLSRWSALQLAVDNEWGGRSSRLKADQIHSDVLSWFTHSSSEDLYIDDLEDKLAEGLLSLNTMVDDGSIEEIAEKLMIMHEECMDGNFTSIEALRESNHRRVPVSHVRQVNDDDNDDDDDENMDERPDSIRNDGSPKMTVGSSKPVSNSNSEHMVVDEPEPGPSAEVEDGWVVVGPRRGRGKKN